MSTTKIKANANIHRLGGVDLMDKEDSRFIEYRRRWKEWPETFTVGEFPLFLDIEVTSVCNLKCPFCATTYRSREIEKGFIPFEIVKNVIDEGADAYVHGFFEIKNRNKGKVVELMVITEK